MRLHDSPAPESYKTSAADRRGSARVDKLLRPPSVNDASLFEDLATDCRDRELPNVLCILSLLGL
jgi:hypothetical protein